MYQMLSWTFANITVTLIQLEDGRILCPMPMLAVALGVTPQALHNHVRRYKQWFDGVVKSNSLLLFKDWVTPNLPAFGLDRYRDDLILWTEHDMILLATMVQGEQSHAFREAVIRLVQEQARHGYILSEESQEKVRQAVETGMALMQPKFDAISERMVKMEQELGIARPAMKAASSAAGIALEAQKRIKGVYDHN